MKAFYQVPQLRDALDTAHRQGHIYSERTSTGRVQYFPRRGKPLARAVELARATPEQVAGIGYPQAKSGGAAPCAEAKAPSGGDAAPVPPAAPRNVAVDFSGEAPMAVRAGSIVCRAYQAMTEATKPITAPALAKQLGVNTPAVAVSLSLLASRQVLTYSPGAKKTIAGTYRMADQPRAVRVLDNCMSSRFKAAADASHRAADAGMALAHAVSGLGAKPIARLQDKLFLLDSLIQTLPYDAELLGEIRKDLTGVAA
ncbi:hypothetical protein C3942_00700 [Solimonas fluminis]|uniref:Uncharacterized protein n=1 Tax=Solimonas fluminis TaxID=2086571 RepID=A0A2S5TKG1_9GAMM|nr:hypothetical protein C3942_00700 [Solimonas fluminis]